MNMADSPVTREELRQELGTFRQEMRQELHQEMAALEERIVERTREAYTEISRDMQTEIIRVFVQFQERNEIRDSNLEKSDGMLLQRVASLEHRLLQIEAKLLLNPPPA
jgi:hypothetical protein